MFNKGNKKISMTEMLQMVVINNNLKINCIKYLDEWGEVDNENDYNLYKEIVK